MFYCCRASVRLLFLSMCNRNGYWGKMSEREKGKEKRKTEEAEEEKSTRSNRLAVMELCVVNKERLFTLQSIRHYIKKNSILYYYSCPESENTFIVRWWLNVTIHNSQQHHPIIIMIMNDSEKCRIERNRENEMDKGEICWRQNRNQDYTTVR